MQWLKPNRAVTGRSAAQLDERVLARWIAQVNQDRSGVQMGRFTRETTFGVINLQMHHLGEQLRQAAYEVLTHGQHVNPRTAPQTSRSALLTAAGREVLGIEILPEHAMGDVTPDDVLFAGSARPPFAWIQTFDRNPQTMRAQKPLMHVEDAEDSLREYMIWDMAFVLGRLVKDWAMYRHGCADRIIPPDPRDNKTLTPLVHAFARSFLGYNECPPFLGCSCLAVQFELARVPEGLLPEVTQPMLLGTLHRELRRQTTPPNGLRWQEWRDAQIKKTDRELRGLTPPPESDER